MSHKSPADPRIKRSHQWMQNALLTLMAKKPYEKIQIKEITELAGLTRPTFYLHYASKNELLASCMDDGFAMFWDMLQKEQIKEVDLPTYTESLFSFWQENAEIMLLILNAGQEAIILPRFHAYITKIIAYFVNINQVELPESLEIKYRIDYAVGGTYLLLVNWLREGCPLSAKDMSSLFLSFTSPIYEQLHSIPQKNFK